MTADDAQDVVRNMWNRYVKETPQRTKLIDVFMAFLVTLGAIQFVYCVLAGNYVCLCFPLLSSFYLQIVIILETDTHVLYSLSTHS